MYRFASRSSLLATAQLGQAKAIYIDHLASIESRWMGNKRKKRRAFSKWKEHQPESLLDDVRAGLFARHPPEGDEAGRPR